MNRFFLYICMAICSAIMLSGCGYHMGTFMHPQVKSIAIAPVVNDSLGYNVAAEMRGKLAEAFMRESSLKVKNLREADCVLYARVTNISYTEVTEVSHDDDKTFRSAEWQIKIKVEFSVIIPGRKEPLIKPRTVTAYTNFQVQADMDTNRRQGTQQACYNAAQQIVDYTTEGW
jgi:outer membrane lipopolysaccharide assembly protein LptE/RlpB